MTYTSIHAKPLTDAELERYRRFVVTLPCAECQMEGYQQCAHYSGDLADWFGRGKGIKAHDLTCFPLCHEASPNRCHTRYDKGELFNNIDDLDMRKVFTSEWALQQSQLTTIAAANAGLFRIPAGR